MAITPIQRAGDTGFASKGSETFGAPPPLLITGDYPAISDQVFRAAAGIDLKAYSVVGVSALTGNLALATRGMAAVRAVGQVDFSGLPAANNTVTVAGRVYTFVAAPVAANQVDIGADAGECAENLAAAINASGDGFFAGTEEHDLVMAEAVGDDVVLAAKWAGSGGNSLALADVGANISHTDFADGRGGVVPIGIVPHPVKIEAGGDSAFFPVYVSGVFNPDALTWDESFATDDQKRTAFLVAQPMFTEIIIRKPGQLQIGSDIERGLDV